jgi:hypothetical protein
MVNNSNNINKSNINLSPQIIEHKEEHQPLTSNHWTQRRTSTSHLKSMNTKKNINLSPQINKHKEEHQPLTSIHWTQVEHQPLTSNHWTQRRTSTSHLKSLNTKKNINLSPQINKHKEEHQPLTSNHWTQRRTRPSILMLFRQWSLYLF